MLPQSQPRKMKNSSRVNLLISLIFHTVLVLALLYLAARQGLLGKKLETIAVTMVKEPPKPKPPEPPKVVQPPKIVEPPKAVAPPKIVETAPPPVTVPTVAPPAAELPGFEFGGGKEVISGSPVQIYKGYMERTLRSEWNKPDDMDDDHYVVEVGVSVDKNGRLGSPVWEKSSGNKKWDDSVKQVFDVVKAFDRPPPTNFPPTVTIRFDVELEDVDSILQ